MCFKPLLIPNKSFDPDNIYSRRYNVCGCGHCPSCIQRRVYDVGFRCSQEFKEIRQRFQTSGDAFACFLTTTYKPKFRPTVHYWYEKQVKNDDGTFTLQRLEATKSCWNMEHIQSFFSSLNSYFSKNFPGSEVKHVMACERGSEGEVYPDEHGVMRTTQGCPHYHFIFFIRGVPELMKQEVIYKIAERWGLYHQPTKKDKHGKSKPGYFESYGRVENIEIDRSSDQCIYYVTKYCYKDAFEPVQAIHASQIISLRNVRSSKSIKPRTLMSNGIGLYFLKQFKDDREFLEFVCNHGDGKTKLVLPRYYFNFRNRDNRPVFKYQRVLLDELSAVIGDPVFKDGELLPYSGKLAPYSFQEKERSFQDILLAHELKEYTLYVSPKSWRPGISFAVTNHDGECIYYDLKKHLVTETLCTWIGRDYITYAFEESLSHALVGLRSFLQFNYKTIDKKYLSTQPFYNQLSADEIAHYERFLAEYYDKACVFVDSCSDEVLASHIARYLHCPDCVSHSIYDAAFLSAMRAFSFWRVYNSCAAWYASDRKWKANKVVKQSQHPELFNKYHPEDSHRLFDGTKLMRVLIK